MDKESDINRRKGLTISTMKTLEPLLKLPNHQNKVESFQSLHSGYCGPPRKPLKKTSAKRALAEYLCKKEEV